MIFGVGAADDHARDGDARGVVGPGVAAPGRSPDGLAIASPLVAAVSSLCWFFLQFLLSLVFSPLSGFSSNFCRPL